MFALRCDHNNLQMVIRAISAKAIHSMKHYTGR